MPDFRGVRFAKGAVKFKPPAPDTTAIPRPLAELGAGKEPKSSTGYAAFCAGNGMFIGGTVSMTECYAYKALLDILGPEGDKWSYQQGALGGRSIPGGAIIDFVVWDILSEAGDHVNIGIRIQTYWFHQARGSFKIQEDVEQQLALDQSGFVVIDVFEAELLRDDDGEGARWAMGDAVAGIQHPNPLASGLVVPQ